MRKIFRSIILLLIPILTIVLTNELVRFNNADSKKSSSQKINSAKKSNQQCSWACHNDTNHCKEHHVKLLNSYFDITDPLYFGIINAMKKTGSYGLANLFIFAFLIPMIILSLLTKAWDLRTAIKKRQ